MRITILLIITILITLTTNTALFAQDHENVELVGRIYDQWRTSYDIEVSDDEFAFVAVGFSGLQIYDIYDIETPELIGVLVTDGFCGDLAVSGDYVYLADANEGLLIISVADHDEPEVVGFWSGIANRIVQSGDYVYVWDHYEGLYVISIVDPEQPEEVTLFEKYDVCYDLTLSGDYIYAAGDRGVSVISIVDPEQPEQVAICATNGMARDVAISGE